MCQSAIVLILIQSQQGGDTMKRALAILLTSAALGSLPIAHAQQHAMVSDAELLAKLKDAAPASVVEHATIMNMGADGKMKIIQQGNNGWTCMDPGGAPMCADKAAMEWAEAWQSKGPAPQTLGFIYMLRGDNGASNTEPYATQETPDNNWIKTGSHVMIVGAEAKGMMQAYPRDARPDPTKPYVMWPGTPYEHLMLPVK
jgi:hypothetical protein